MFPVLLFQYLPLRHFQHNISERTTIVNFSDTDGNDTMREQIQFNYERIKNEILQLVEDEKTWIKNDPNLKDLSKDEQ